MRKLGFLFILLIFVPGINLCFAENISFNLEPHFFTWNAELDSPFRPGETIIGGSLKSYFSFRQTDHLTLNLGVWGILFYGDEDFVSDVKPLLSYTFHLDDSFYFTMGYLNNEDRHYMLDAIQSEELEYTRQIDYGFQVLLKNRYSRFDTWLNWNLLNTPEQREYLDIGTNLFLYIFNFIFNVQGYWSHHGGELFQSEPVQNFYQLALGIENFYTINTRILTKVGYKLYYLADREKIEAIPGSTGKGFSGELYFYLRNFKLYFDYWKGDNFITEEGDPLYRTDGWIFGGVRNETRISNITDFILDLRLHYFEDNEVFSYEYRFEFKTALGYRIKK